MGKYILVVDDSPTIGVCVEYALKTVSSSISDDNVRIEKLMIEMDIPIAENEIGSDYTRKLLLDVRTGRVFLKKSTRKSIIEEIGRLEVEYDGRSLENE